MSKNPVHVLELMPSECPMVVNATITHIRADLT